MTAKKSESSFEEAIERLENLTDSMENGDIPLSDLVAKFEEGSKLLKACQTELKKAELKIEQLNLDSGTTEAFDDAANA